MLIRSPRRSAWNPVRTRDSCRCGIWRFRPHNANRSALSRKPVKAGAGDRARSPNTSLRRSTHTQTLFEQNKNGLGRALSPVPCPLALALCPQHAVFLGLLLAPVSRPRCVHLQRYRILGRLRRCPSRSRNRFQRWHYRSLLRLGLPLRFCHRPYRSGSVPRCRRG